MSVYVVLMKLKIFRAISFLKCTVGCRLSQLQCHNLHVLRNSDKAINTFSAQLYISFDHSLWLKMLDFVNLK